MKRFLDVVSEEMMAAFKAAGYDEKWEELRYPTDRICASISVMEQWREQRYITKRPL